MTQEQQSSASGAVLGEITIADASGAPVADNANIMTAGPRGAALLQDIWLIGT